MVPTESNVCRIAMWSGPRNISTAMMRSFESRSDTFVTDEPFYAHYLFATGLEHPGYAEVIASQDTDWRNVAGYLTGPVPNEKRVWYQKQMAHHQLPEMGMDWMLNSEFQHTFLIREPVEMLPSLIKILGECISVQQTGYGQQVDIFRFIRSATDSIVVVDSKDVLSHPERMLRILCKKFDLTYEPQMLNWKPGPRETDGVWAKHWYDRVHGTTTFSKYIAKDEAVPASKLDLLKECQDLYDELAEFKITP